MAVSDSPCLQVTLADTSRQFMESQELNANTRRKTKRDVLMLIEFLKTAKSEVRKIEEIPPAELNEYLVEFISSVKKKNSNDDYDPCTLKSFISSFDRYLKSKNYGHSIVKDAVFERTIKALHAKQMDLKLKKGMGDKPNAFKALNPSEIQSLYEQNILGTSSPDRLLNLICLNNTVYFGLNGGKEHRLLSWGDVKLHQNESGREYIQYNGLSKTIAKVFSVQHCGDKCPVAVYKFYAKKRPMDMNGDDAPFYLATNTFSPSSDNPWFKRQPVGQNKLTTMMKTMSEKAYSYRGTNIKTTHSEPATDIQSTEAVTTVQLSGQKSMQSVDDHSVLFTLMQPINSPKLESVEGKHSEPHLSTFHETSVRQNTFPKSVRSRKQSKPMKSKIKREKDDEQSQCKRFKDLSDSNGIA